MSTTATPKADEVFGITELCEQILLDVSPRQLFGLQRTSPRWRNVIQGSEKLMKRMFLLAEGAAVKPLSLPRPDDPTSRQYHQPLYNQPVRINPMVNHAVSEMYTVEEIAKHEVNRIECFAEYRILDTEPRFLWAFLGLGTLESPDMRGFDRGDERPASQLDPRHLSSREPAVSQGSWRKMYMT